LVLKYHAPKTLVVGVKKDMDSYGQVTFLYGRRGTDATLSSQEEERGMYLSYGIIDRNQLVFGHFITTTVPGFD
jgi:hypothetical protein